MCGDEKVGNAKYGEAELVVRESVPFQVKNALTHDVLVELREELGVVEGVVDAPVSEDQVWKPILYAMLQVNLLDAYLMSIGRHVDNRLHLVPMRG